MRTSFDPAGADSDQLTCTIVEIRLGLMPDAVFVATTVRPVGVDGGVVGVVPLTVANCGTRWILTLEGRDTTAPTAAVTENV